MILYQSARKQTVKGAESNRIKMSQWRHAAVDACSDHPQTPQQPSAINLLSTMAKLSLMATALNARLHSGKQALPVLTRP
jgi:hypothetical protein